MILTMFCWRSRSLVLPVRSCVGDFVGRCPELKGLRHDRFHPLRVEAIALSSPERSISTIPLEELQ
ncbi:hypothetical protein [Chroococcidiopsis sp [FACHB-1243]]|uniref:hypothetical protein n=1 Tax=Chroococcidiopsis sp. [FACHB-1243] TaxID=2692781 RepID=UPI00177D0949|nr:hypothetical protein [Chroococcidiopsis sp. [FACHB-1243]]